MPALYSGASLFIFPSFLEGFGLPPLEAMACGCVVLSSRNSSLPEALGKEAIYFDPFNVEELREKMAYCLNHPEIQKDLKEKGIERVKSFRPQKMAKEILECIESVLNK